jgi:polyphosphate kinase
MAEVMGAATALISVGDDGVLNARIAPSLAEIWIDRDLSWLDFNERVLAEALDERTPLAERAKFLAIFTSNLDEFFMKRVAVLRETLTPDRVELLGRIRNRLLPMLERRAECYRHAILPGLADHGIYLRTWDELTPAQQDEAGRYFDANVSAALTPLVIDPAHPFPFLANLSTSLAFVLHDASRKESVYARVRVPSLLRQWIPLESGVASGQQVLVPLHELICGNIGKLYGGMEVSAATLFRLTRDAEVEIDEEEDPGATLGELVKEQIRQRRYQPVVRIEFGPEPDPGIREMLRERFQLTPLDMYDAGEEMDFVTLFEIAGLPVAEIRDSAWTPLTPPQLDDDPASIYDALQHGDLPVHHPYDSFDASVERFISAAADDPQTVAIKMTAYRIGDDTPFIRSLVRAAESGKQVACVIEIKARFDEDRNLRLAQELERAGAHVTYGVRGLKTHAKIALVVRKEAGGLRSYVHVGTGNYNVRTARMYADLSLLTCDAAIARDVVNLFHYLTGRSVAPDCERLLVAPTTMRPRFLELIHRETQNQRAGRPARIVAKMNQLEDPAMIEALLEAAEAGVPIDLIVRGFCCLLPGVAGRSEGIRVRSIIGRFLEHSRIFHFAAGKEDPVEGEFYIGSADWMYRNLSRRIEVVTPVTSRGPKERLWEILDICLRDRRHAWVLDSAGVYTQLRPDETLEGPESAGTHATLMELARRRSEL